MKSFEGMGVNLHPYPQIAVCKIAPEFVDPIAVNREAIPIRNVPRMDDLGQLRGIGPEADPVELAFSLVLAA
jgi:hypothetical protein